MKTAGTSVEVYLSQYCDHDDIVTPIIPHVEPHRPRNYRGIWNPLPEIIEKRASYVRRDIKDFITFRKFYNHIPALSIRHRVSDDIWNNYYKFCIERNPWDKTLSDYHMFKDRANGELTLEDYIDKGRFCLNYPKYTDLEGKMIVDRVIKYESLSESLGEVFELVGVPYSGSLGVKAKSEHRRDTTHYRDVLSEDQRKIIDNAFQIEIDMHGYEY